MKKTNEINALMIVFLDDVTSANNEVLFGDKAKEIIKEIAEFARNSVIYKESKSKAEDFYKEMPSLTATSLYTLMLERVVNAPTKILRDYSVILHMPKLNELVNGIEVSI